MKRVVLILFALLCLQPTVWSYDFSANCASGQTLYYSINGNSTTVTITHPGPTGSEWSGYAMPEGVLVLPETVVHAGVTYPVNAIGSHAFIGCSAITSITVPQSITTISNDILTNAGVDTLHFFATGCDDKLRRNIWGNVKYLFVGGGSHQIPTQAFANDSLLQQVVLDSIVIIGSQAFKNCVALQSITLPTTLTTLSNNVFSGCTGLTEVIYNGSISDWCGISFMNSVANPVGFSHSLTLGGSELHTLIIPTGLQSIGNYAFYGCASIDNVVIPPTITHIGSEAFVGTGLDSLKFYATGCDTYVRANNFGGVRNLTTGGGTRMITSGAFQNDTLLETATLDSVTLVGLRAFRRCSRLDTIRLSPMIDTIADYAFSECGALAFIESPCTTVPYTERNAFADAPSTTIVSIPCGTTALYQESWSQFTHFQEPSSSVVTLLSNDSTMGEVSVIVAPTCSNPTAIVEAIAHEGYHFEAWNDGDSLNPRTLTTIGDTTLVAFFAKNSYVVSLTSSDSTMGFTTGGGLYAYLDTIEIHAYATSHHHFLHWQDLSQENPRQIIVTGDMHYEATFAADSHHITVGSAQPEWGSTTGSGNYPFGTSVTIAAQAHENHHFTGWSDGITLNPRQILLISDTILYAFFAADSHLVSLQANNDLYGSVSGGGMVPHGDTITITATPYEHYHFLRWQDGDTHNPRNIIVLEPLSFEAFFVADSHHIQVRPNNAHYGTVTGGGIYPYGEEVSLEAQPNANYQFLHWSDGATDNPYTFTVICDSIFTAIFETLEAIDNPECHINIQSKNQSIIISGAPKQFLRIYDLSGKIVHNGILQEYNAYRMPVKGIYIVVIGDLPPKQILVAE